MMDTPKPSTPLSRHPGTAWVMLAIAAPLGGWLFYEIHRTIGLDSPRLWELLRTDRVFDVAMLDFALTASWAFLVLVERSSWKDWRLWVTTPIFFVIPSLGIIAFLLLDRVGRGQRPDEGRKTISS
jgi:hypothetical protein